MNVNHTNAIVQATVKKDPITTALKVLSAIYLIMNIIRLGKELTRKDIETRKTSSK